LGVKIDRNKISDRYAFAWFEEATKQDEAEIQDLFADLLIQAANGNEFATDRKNIDLIGKMSPTDARIFFHKLAYLQINRFNNKEDWFIINTLYNLEVTNVKNLDIENAELAIENMIHLGLFEKHFKIDERKLENAFSEAAISYAQPSSISKKIKDALIVREYIGVTERAIALARAVRPDKFRI
jgi:hypothetical protein